MFAVAFSLWFAENVVTLVPFFCIVKVPLFTVGIVGLLLKSLYEPLKATVLRSVKNFFIFPNNVGIDSPLTIFALVDASVNVGFFTSATSCVWLLFALPLNKLSVSVLV